VSTSNLAVFCDYENVAIGARDAKYDLSVGEILERLLDKGKVIVKKAYADWGRYASARRPLHEHGFEMVEIPHVSYSGKNSADIRLVVDALDLCHAKAHIDAFAIISGDSDFSPLVAKLRENGRQVIGVGVKNSTSDLLVESCDEFIYYDDLVRSKRRQGRQKKAPRRESGEDDRAREALDLVIDTVESLLHERDEHFHGSLVKQTLKRKRPHFSESYHGFRSFNQLLEEAEREGLLELEKDERSGGYVIEGLGPAS
jgi:uncharacterized protein (TIGR00288 family)